MSHGAFRDAGAAIERVAVLEQEKDELEAEVAKLRAEVRDLRAAHEGATEAPGEVAKLKVRLAAERADLKEALSELLPVRKQLEAAERAFHQARGDRDLAVDEAARAVAELDVARKEIDGLREKLREERRKASASEPREPAIRVPENLDAYMQRIQDERDELREELRLRKEAAERAPRPSLLAALFGRR
jgi:chromosome segregation ATPase